MVIGFNNDYPFIGLPSGVVEKSNYFNHFYNFDVIFLLICGKENYVNTYVNS